MTVGPNLVESAVFAPLPSSFGPSRAFVFTRPFSNLDNPGRIGRKAGIVPRLYHLDPNFLSLFQSTNHRFFRYAVFLIDKALYKAGIVRWIVLSNRGMGMPLAVQSGMFHRADVRTFRTDFWLMKNNENPSFYHPKAFKNKHLIAFAPIDSTLLISLLSIDN